MTKDVVTIEKGRPLIDAAKSMKKHGIGSVVVTDSKQAIGILTERDIVHKIIAAGKDIGTSKVEDIMSKPLRVIRPESDIESAAQAMAKNKIKRLPVINAKNELVGIISEEDISRLLPSIIDLVEERAVLGK